jgi:hypothetical protein
VLPLLLAGHAARGGRLRLEATGLDHGAAIRAFAVVALREALERRLDLPQFVAVALDFRCTDLVDGPAVGEILGIGHTRTGVGAVVHLAMVCQFLPELRRTLLERFPDTLDLVVSEVGHGSILGSSTAAKLAPDQSKRWFGDGRPTPDAVVSFPRLAAAVRRDQDVRPPPASAVTVG